MMRVTADIPIVIAAAGDPVGAGLVSSRDQAATSPAISCRNRPSWQEDLTVARSCLRLGCLAGQDQGRPFSL